MDTVRGYLWMPVAVHDGFHSERMSPPLADCLRTMWTGRAIHPYTTFDNALLERHRAAGTSGGLSLPCGLALRVGVLVVGTLRFLGTARA